MSDVNKLMLNMRKYVFEHRASSDSPTEAAQGWVEQTIFPAHCKGKLKADAIAKLASREYTRIGTMPNHEWAKSFWLKIASSIEEELSKLTSKKSA